MEKDSPGKVEDPGGVAEMFRAPEWGLVAGIVAVLALIYFVDDTHAFFQAYSLRDAVHGWPCSACWRSAPPW